MGFFRGEKLADGTFKPSRITDWSLPDKSIGAKLNGLGETQPRPAKNIFPAADQKDHPLIKWQRQWFVRLMTGTWRTGYHLIVYILHEKFRVKPVADVKVKKSAEEFTSALKEYALSLDNVDVIGVTQLKREYFYDGYQDTEISKLPWVIIIGRAMDYEKAKVNLEGNFGPTVEQVFGGYERSKKAAMQIANWIREQGYFAEGHGGLEENPEKVLLNIPAAQAAGIGELGKNGSLLSDTMGSAFRTADIVTDLPLIPDQPREIGADDFCLNCQKCTEACPPGAISDEKKVVRGVEKWYVDFDKCAPFMSENLGCALCLTSCPWSMPSVAERLSKKMLKRKERKKLDA